MKNKKQNKLYTKGYWYLNTYKALGSGWLIETLEFLDLKYEFNFANLSANAAWYEAEVYEQIKVKKHPRFYMSDIQAENLHDKKRASYENFIYLEGQRDASEVTSELFENKKMDVILDCKGALWYATKIGHTDINQLIKILTTYRNLLSDDGVLIIDFYDDYNILNALKYELSGGNVREIKVKNFAEPSTKKNLQKIFGKNFIDKHCNKIEIAGQKEYPLSYSMGTAYMKVEDLDAAIKIINTNKHIAIKYKIAICFRKINKLIQYIIIFLIIFLIIFFICIN